MMPDCTLCEGTGCPIKEKCYRYRAIPSEYRQAYFDEVPYKEGKCDEFIKFHEGSRTKK